MEWKDSYFEDEVREGFYVPSMVKRAWAAELEVLSQVDRICKKYEIPYFADWGTLLGAVRHGGFIPWDDDMDISMKRADYNRFMEVAGKELPEGYEVYNYKENADYWGFVTRVVAKRRICFEEEHLKQYHGFPYIVGIDIFLLDYVCADEEKEQQRVTICNYVIALADGMAEGRITGHEAEAGLQRVEAISGIAIDRTQNINQLRVQLYDLAVGYFSMFNEEESDTLTRMMPDGLHGNKRLRLPKKYYEQALWMPFENTKVPVPIAYDEMLTRRYGDYMKLVRDTGGHDYPFYEMQKKQLQSVLDFDIPHFTFSKEMLKKEKVTREKSLKRIAEEYQNNSVQLINEIKGDIEKDITEAIAEADCEELLTKIVEGQQYAIDFATLIEQCRGEGSAIVGCLEQYCEGLYQFYEMVSKGTRAGSSVEAGEMNRGYRDILRRLDDAVTAANDRITEDLLNRRTVVFLPFKSAYWNAMKSVYEAAVQDEDCDVYVIPIPYYYKDYDGTFTNMQYEGGQFPKDVPITYYEAFDFSLQAPETIVIQNPYDEWNEAISVPREFYSSRLKNYTDKLVYIPYFKVEEFYKENYREYHNMQCYCTVPGVIHADCVIVQSENMMQRYIEKLVEFAGEETRTIWERKISGRESRFQDGQQDDRFDCDIPEEWKKWMFNADEIRKKVILFRVESCSLVQYQYGAIEKIKHVLEIFYKSRESVELIWNADPFMEENIRSVDEDLWTSYHALVQQYKDQGWGIQDGSTDGAFSCRLCDAYYGDASRQAQKCRLMEKPTMLMNYEI